MISLVSHRSEKEKNRKRKRAGNKRNEAKKSKRNVKEPENCLNKKMLKVVCILVYCTDVLLYLNSEYETVSEKAEC